MTELNTLLEALANALRAWNPTPAVFPHGDPAGTGAEVIAIRDGFRLERLRGPIKKARYHVFADIQSFAQWLNRHGAGREETVEILAHDQVISAALSPSDMAGDYVRCELQWHPLFREWKEIFTAGAMSQKALYSRLRAVRSTLGPLASAPELTAGELLLQELLKVEALSSEGVSGHLDPRRGFHHYQGRTAKQTIEGNIPAEMAVSTPIFSGLDDRAADLCQRYRLTVLVGLDFADGNVSFTLTCPELEVTLQAARLDAVRALTYLLNPGFLVGLGKIDLREVNKA